MTFAPHPFLPAPPPMATRPTRSRFVTALAWVVIAVSALLVPVSFIALLMLLSGGDGTANATLLGGLVVIGGPPVTLLAGIGLSRRWRWAHVYSVALMVVTIALHGMALVRGPTPARTYVSPTGVPTTVLASEENNSLHLLAIAIALGLLVIFLTPGVRAEFRGEKQ